jgi:hypothetical protein
VDSTWRAWTRWLPLHSPPSLRSGSPPPAEHWAVMSTRPRPTCRTTGARRHRDRFRRGPRFWRRPRLIKTSKLWAASALDLDRGAETGTNFWPRSVDQPASAPFASNRIIACVVVPVVAAGFVGAQMSASVLRYRVRGPYPAGTRYPDAGCKHGRVGIWWWRIGDGLDPTAGSGNSIILAHQGTNELLTVYLCIVRGSITRSVGTGYRWF